MQIGSLRHRIALESFTTSSDGMGGGTATWATEVLNLPAAIWPTSAKEQRQAAAPTMSISHQIRIRYYEGISAAWRVKFGTRYFSITSIVDFEERHIYMDLLCREVLT